MGLMFCQRVMQAINGTIEVQSTVGEGTMATLYFQAVESVPPSGPPRRFSIRLGPFPYSEEKERCWA